MDSKAHERTLLQKLARLDKRTAELDQIKAEIYHQHDALDWAWLLLESMRERVPTLLIRPLVPLEAETDFQIPEATLDTLWNVQALHDLYFKEYARAPSYLRPLARLNYAVDMRRRSIAQTLTVTLDILQDSAIKALVVKGAALTPLYPSDCRDSADIDVVLPNTDDIWSVIRHAGTHGFTPGVLSVSKRSSRGWSIKTTLKSGQGAEIDLHAGGFDLIAHGFLEAPLMERAEPMRLAGDAWTTVPSAEDSLLIVAAHLCREGDLTLRDINDAYVLLAQRLDWSYIRRVAHGNALGGPLKALLTKVSEIYPNVAVPRELRGTSAIEKYIETTLRRKKPNRRLWAVPTQIHHIIAYDSRRYGIATAVRHAFIQSLMALEKDLRSVGPSGYGRSLGDWTAVSSHRIVIALLLRRGWALWKPPIGGSIWFRPVSAIVDGRELEVTTVRVRDQDEMPAGLAGLVKLCSGVLLCRSPSPNDPELLITPAGVFYSTRFEDTVYPCPLSRVQHRAGKTVQALNSMGSVNARGRDGVKQDATSDASDNDHTT